MEENRTCYRPEGAVSVNRAKELQEHILEELEREKSLLIDFSRVTRIDLSFIQILFALKKESDIRNVRIEFTGMNSGVMKNELLKAGCDEKFFL